MSVPPESLSPDPPRCTQPSRVHARPSKEHPDQVAASSGTGLELKPKPGLTQKRQLVEEQREHVESHLPIEADDGSVLAEGIDYFVPRGSTTKEPV